MADAMMKSENALLVGWQDVNNGARGPFLVESLNTHHAPDPDATVALDNRVHPTFIVALPFQA